MIQIFHKVTIEVEKEKVYRAISNIEEMKKWWVRKAELEGEGNVGSKYKFYYGESEFYNIIEVKKLEDGKKVVWEVLENKSPTPEGDVWKGTEIEFDLEEKKLKRLEGKTVTILRFKHKDWTGEEDDFYADCNFHWAFFLGSLKSYLEKGQGTPM
jgi:uncharacterized protein YndB with AHSA1/START domain